MPLVKLELVKGRNDLIALKDTIMDCVQTALKLKPDDRNIRVIEYEPQLFEMKNPYKLLIEITLFSGRTKETKKNLYQAIVNKIEENFDIKKEAVFIVLNEQILENWGIRGGIPADEVVLGFKVNI